MSLTINFLLKRLLRWHLVLGQRLAVFCGDNGDKFAKTPVDFQGWCSDLKLLWWCFGLPWFWFLLWTKWDLEFHYLVLYMSKKYFLMENFTVTLVTQRFAWFWYQRKYIYIYTSFPGMEEIYCKCKQTGNHLWFLLFVLTLFPLIASLISLFWLMPHIFGSFSLVAFISTALILSRQLL